jgi:hypothetical protein
MNLTSPIGKIDTSNLYDVPNRRSQISPFNMDSMSDIASSNWSQSMRSGVRETLYVEELQFKLLIVDMDSQGMSKTVSLKTKSIAELDQKLQELGQSKCYILILQKNLFRCNCN